MFSKKAALIIGLVVLVGAALLFIKSTAQESGFEDKITKAKSELPASKTEVNVDLANYSFSPDIIKVKKGVKVTWTNQDNAPHTVTSDTGTSIKSQVLKKGDSFSRVFDATGVYRYHCTPHPQMLGAIIVVE